MAVTVGGAIATFENALAAETQTEIAQFQKAFIRDVVRLLRGLQNGGPPRPQIEFGAIGNAIAPGVQPFAGRKKE